MDEYAQTKVSQYGMSRKVITRPVSCESNRRKDNCASIHTMSRNIQFKASDVVLHAGRLGMPYRPGPRGASNGAGQEAEGCAIGAGGSTRLK